MIVTMRSCDLPEFSRSDFMAAIRAEKDRVSNEIIALNRERETIQSRIRDLELRVAHLDALLPINLTPDVEHVLLIPLHSGATWERESRGKIWEVLASGSGITTYHGTAENGCWINPMQHFMCENAVGNGFRASGINPDGSLYAGKGGPFEDASAGKRPFQNSHACAKTMKALRIAANMVKQGAAERITCKDGNKTEFIVKPCGGCDFPRITDGMGIRAHAKKSLPTVTVCQCRP